MAVGGPAATAGKAPSNEASVPAPTLPPNQQQQPALKAGEIDDNANWDDYRTYVNSYIGPFTKPINISQRYILTVVDEQNRPITDARVTVSADNEQLFVGRTYAGGQTIFHPLALNPQFNANTFQVRVEKAGSSVEKEFSANQGDRPILVLPNAPAPEARPRLDILFLLDATGSMSDELRRIQETIVSIADRIDGMQPQPELRFGLVAYRDYGDEYVTKVFDFTSNATEFQRTLLTIQAAGGGDEPEALASGLNQVNQGVNWANDAIRLVFLVADAPPQIGGQEPYNYVQEAQVAVARGIKIFPIAASNSSSQAEFVFRQLAQQTLGSFLFLTYQQGESSGAPGNSTEMNVDPSQFTVERLDDLVVQIVKRELAKTTQ
jgi:uncharacterized protein YegL